VRERFVDSKWGEKVRLRAVSGPDFYVVTMEIIGPHGGRGSYVVLEESQARELAEALHLSLAEVDIERGREEAAA
jgi:hypothetical protein